MKKFLSFLLLLISLPCYGGNFQQNQFDSGMSADVQQNEAFTKISKEQLLLNDYQGYLNGGRSLYGYLLLNIQESKDSRKMLDLKYAQLMKKNYDIRIKTTNSALFKLPKIQVDDKDFVQLTQTTKVNLYFYNLLSY